jgi:hypothetical protein
MNSTDTTHTGSSGQVMWIHWFDLNNHVNAFLGNEVYCHRAVAMPLFPTLECKYNFHYVTMHTSLFHVKHGLPYWEGHSFNGVAFCLATPSRLVSG